MIVRLNSVELEKLEKEFNVNAKISYRDLAQKTGVSHHYCRLYLRQKRNRVFVDSKNQVDRLEKNEWKKKYQDALKEVGRMRSVFDNMFELNNAKHKNGNFKIVPKKDDKREVTAVLVGSDWHIDECVCPETVNHMNEYNMELAEKSVEQFFVNGMKLVKKEQHSSIVNNVVVAFLGDLMSGYIHDELVENNSCSPVECCVKLRDMLVAGLQYVLDNFDGGITVVCSYGNHGRTTQKMRHATHAQNNFEYLIFQMVSKAFAKEKRINFIIEKGYLTYLKVYDMTLRFHHGNNIKYGGGIGGITIPINKKISQWNRGRRADLDVMGHFHQFFDGGNFIVNGSVIGYNAFAVAIGAAYENPKQAFFIVDSKYGKTIVSPIFIER